MKRWGGRDGSSFASIEREATGCGSWKRVLGAGTAARAAHDGRAAGATIHATVKPAPGTKISARPHGGRGSSGRSHPTVLATTVPAAAMPATATMLAAVAMGTAQHSTQPAHLPWPHLRAVVR